MKEGDGNEKKVAYKRRIIDCSFVVSRNLTIEFKHKVSFNGLLLDESPKDE